MKSNTKYQKKIFVIRGTSNGMTKATAIELAKNDAKVILGARRTEKLQQIVMKLKTKV